MAQKRNVPEGVAAEHKMYTEAIPLSAQIQIIAETFNLDPAPAYQNAQHLPPRPMFSVPGTLRPRHVHWLAFPALEALGVQLFSHESDAYARELQSRSILKRHLEKIMHVHMLLDGTMRTEVRAKRAIGVLKETQKSPILIVAMQRGIRYLGKSVVEVCESVHGGEYGLTFTMGTALILTHPHLFNEGNRFCMDLPGTEIFTRNKAITRQKEPYVEAPFVRFLKRRLVLSSSHVRNTDNYSGSATFFLPHTLMNRV